MTRRRIAWLAVLVAVVAVVAAGALTLARLPELARRGWKENL